MWETLWDLIKQQAVSVAIIAAMGSIIVAAVSNICLVYEKRRESLIRQREENEKLYSSFLLSLQQIMNAEDKNKAFPAFQEQCLKSMVHGHHKAAQATVDYFNKLTMEPEKLFAKDHQMHQQRIINGIRKAQGLRKIKHVNIIMFTPDGRT